MARNLVPLAASDEARIAALVDRCVGLPSELNAQWWCYEDVPQIRRFLPLFTPYFELDSQYFSAQRRKRIYIGNLPKPVEQSNDTRLSQHLRPGPFRIGQKVLRSRPCRAKTYTATTFYDWDPAAKSPTVIGLSSRHDNYAAVGFPGGYRQLQWQELASLQGFPADYTFIGSPTSTSKMISQAVQIDTARAILSRFIEDLSHA